MKLYILITAIIFCIIEVRVTLEIKLRSSYLLDKCPHTWTMTQAFIFQTETHIFAQNQSQTMLFYLNLQSS
jgi:hypothetical protein